MSIEGHARSSLRKMILFRILGDLLSAPQIVIQPMKLFCHLLGKLSKDLELSVFQLELDAARRYKLLTGIDLPTAAGEPGRYGALDAERNEILQDAYMQQATDHDPDVE